MSNRRTKTSKFTHQDSPSPLVLLEFYLNLLIPFCHSHDLHERVHSGVFPPFYRYLFPVTPTRTDFPDLSSPITSGRIVSRYLIEVSGGLTYLRLSQNLRAPTKGPGPHRTFGVLQRTRGCSHILLVTYPFLERLTLLSSTSGFRWSHLPSHLPIPVYRPMTDSTREGGVGKP